MAEWSFCPELTMRHKQVYYLLTQRQKVLSSTARRYIEWLTDEARRPAA